MACYVSDAVTQQTTVAALSFPSGMIKFESIFNSLPTVNGPQLIEDLKDC